MIRVDGEHNLVLVLRREQPVWCGADAAVVVLVPHDHDRVAAFMPYARGFDALDQPLDGDVALQNQAGIQANLRAESQAGGVGAEVESTERVAIASAMLVVALAGRDEGQGRHITAGQIRIQATRTVEADNVFQTIVPRHSLLHVFEVYERIMLRGIRLYDASRGQRREF